MQKTGSAGSSDRASYYLLSNATLTEAVYAAAECDGTNAYVQQVTLVSSAPYKRGAPSKSVLHLWLPPPFQAPKTQENVIPQLALEHSTCWVCKFFE